MTQRHVISGAKVATLAGEADGIGLVDDAAIVVDGASIAWVGPAADLPSEHAGLPRQEHTGRVITPALIDCHTHIVHGGNRAREFEMRLNGASYEEIARAGGGIVSTVAATRGDRGRTVVQRPAPHRRDDCRRRRHAGGQVGLRSGPRHRTEDAARRPRHRPGAPVHVVTSFLGAHAVPAGADADFYIDAVCLPALEAAHAEGLVDAVDGFCEGIAFRPAQIARVFDKGAQLGLPVKLHAEQFSHLGGTALAAPLRRAVRRSCGIRHGRRCAGHGRGRHGGRAAARRLLHDARNATPPVEAFRDHGVPMAVATDWNPGSSPMGSLLLAMNMACTLFRMTPAEALAGTTRNAARALGLTDRGVIAPGQRADLASGTSSRPPNCPTGSASTRCMAHLRRCRMSTS
jgi:imidazolonepropionase